jgi:hypothetical protein
MQVLGAMDATPVPVGVHDALNEVPVVYPRHIRVVDILGRGPLCWTSHRAIDGCESDH